MGDCCDGLVYCTTCFMYFTKFISVIQPVALKKKKKLYVSMACTIT